MLKLNNFFQDKAVFQRGKSIPVWGRADADSKIKVEFAGSTFYGKSNIDGAFKIRLQAVGAGGPYTLKVTVCSSGETVVCNDILVGDVWLASGQSNMEYQLGSDWAFPHNLRNNPNSLARRQQREYVAGIRNPAKLRYFYVPHNCTGVRESRVPGTWKYVDEKSAAGFSAAAAWFAKTIQEQLDIPVGVIVTAWGGTRVEAWTSREGLLSNPDTAVMANVADRELQKPEIWDVLARKKAAQKDLKRDPGNKGFGLGYVYVTCSLRNSRICKDSG